MEEFPNNHTNESSFQRTDNCKLKLCAKCKLHGVRSPIKDMHKLYCKFKNCACKGCEKVTRNRVMCAESTRRRRELERLQKQGKCMDNRVDGNNFPPSRVSYGSRVVPSSPNVRIVPWCDLISVPRRFLESRESHPPIIDNSSIGLPTVYGPRAPLAGMPRPYGLPVASGSPVTVSSSYNDVNVDAFNRRAMEYASHDCRSPAELQGSDGRPYRVLVGEHTGNVWRMQNPFMAKPTPCPNLQTASADQQHATVTQLQMYQHPSQALHTVTPQPRHEAVQYKEPQRFFQDYIHDSDPEVVGDSAPIGVTRYESLPAEPYDTEDSSSCINEQECGGEIGSGDK